MDNGKVKTSIKIEQKKRGFLMKEFITNTLVFYIMGLDKIMDESQNLVKINENISYLPATQSPLSCDVIFIKTDNATWIYDVGLNNRAAEEINKVEGQKNVVISHFHPDHILNLSRVKWDNLYVSSNTKKYTLRGTVIKGEQTFNENPEIKILELPSSHAKGCLCLICGDYAFLGDGTYCKPIRGHHTYNAQLLLEMIKTLEKIDAQNFCLSHDKNFIQSKDEVIQRYKDIYASRTPDNPKIDVESFFNPDGSVKEV